jgi:amino acid adenylation domain-containing protein
MTAASAEPAATRANQAPGEDGFALTAMQEAMLLGSLRRGPAFELQQLVVKLEVNLDSARLLKAWHAVVARHPMLRARILWQGASAPTQVVAPNVDVVMSLQSPDDVDSFLAQDREQGIDVSVAPAFRLTLLNALGAQPVMVFSHHHALLDGRSVRVLVEEVLSLYDQPEGPMTPPVTPPVGNAFQAHCHARACIDPTDAQAYFRSTFDGVEPLTFPQSQGASAASAATTKRASVVDVVPLPTHRGAMAPQTVASMVQVAWGLLLSLHCQRDDVVFGVTRHGRRLVDGARNALGCFINTVPVRLRVQPQLAVANLVQQVQAQSVDVRPHEHTALSDIQSWLGLSSPLFDSVVVFERYALDADLKASNSAFRHRTVQLLEQSSFPLVVAVYQDGPSLWVSMEFDAFDGSVPWMNKVLARFQTALQQVFADSAVAVRDLHWLLPGEEAALREQARGPLVGTLSEKRFADWFSGMVATQPQAIAMLTQQGERVTYEQMHACALAFMQRFAGLTDASTRTVAVVGARTWQSVSAQLACFLCDWTVVPMDATWPLERIEQMLSMAKPVIVLTQDAAQATAVKAMPRAHGVAASTMDDFLAAPAPQAKNPLNPSQPTQHQQAAYLTFTSGTTGAPKGVCIAMQSLLAHAAGTIDAYALTPSDRVLQFASPAFDVAFEECVPTLLSGGALVERATDGVSDFDALLQTLASAKVTVINLPSGYFHALIQHLDERGKKLPACVRLVVIGSEKPSTWSVQKFLMQHPQTRLFNAYGTAETTITSMGCDLGALQADGGGATEVPIGKPFGAGEAFLVDACLRLCPPGIEGEVCIGGPQVAMGYLQGTPADQGRFIRSPLDGGRAYLTGDVGRLRADGQLVLLGRRDGQVKVRGVRVEPSEVEEVMRGLDGVADAAVVIRKGKQGDALVAFVVPKPGSLMGEPTDVRQRLALKLPEAFLPSEFRWMAALPVHANGKLDRLTLSREAQTVLIADRVTAVPQSDLELYLHGVFCRLLHRDDVGMDDNFFDMGGHSLLAIRLLGALNQVAQPALPLTVVFKAPSIRGLATLVGTNDHVALPTVVPLNAKAIERTDAVASGETSGPTAVFFVAGVQLYAGLARAMNSHSPAFGMFLKAEEEVLTHQRNRLDIREMARAYVASLRAFQPHGPYILGGFSVGGLLSYEMARQIRAEGDLVEGVILLDTILPWSVHSKGLVVSTRAWGRRTIERVTGMHPAEGWVQFRQWAKLSKRPAHQDHGEARLRKRRERVLGVAVDRYCRTLQPYDGRVLLARTSDPLGLQAKHVDGDLGWAGLLDPSTHVLTIEGEHLSLLMPPGEAAIAQALACHWWGLTADDGQGTTLSNLPFRRRS